ncbi:response regulator transcription factor [Sulfuricurvum sp.]|uniref:response regulator transcription factor n=1 Tax=Sulfuricurvum sp. TaxID=2025608 RepID=UPI002E359537|nr:response regulator transcription factor [Sulfuricurvum sp.]HEX5330935.1 response regulator transcription factor [Sulfuricurvum sp.]
MKITLFEDEYALRTNINDFLTLHSYEVEMFGNGNVMLDQCRFNSDLYILDINAPGANGFEVIEWITRNDPGKPVIFMSAYTDIESITRAYHLGCSDYLKKPFELMELLLRVQKLLSHVGDDMIYITSIHAFDLASKQLYAGGSIVNLTKNQRNILYLLTKHRNSVITYDMLIEYIWEDKFIKFNTIASHIREIRAAVKEIMIQNIRGEGYMLKVV